MPLCYAAFKCHLELYCRAGDRAQLLNTRGVAKTARATDLLQLVQRMLLLVRRAEHDARHESAQLCGQSLCIGDTT